MAMTPSSCRLSPSTIEVAVFKVIFTKVMFVKNRVTTRKMQHLEGLDKAKIFATMEVSREALISESKEWEESLMANEIRYRKPSLTNLPYELGKMIFEEMDKAPRRDDAKMQAECDRLMEQIDAVLARDYAEGYSTE